MGWDMIIGHDGKRVRRNACLGEGTDANKITEV